MTTTLARLMARTDLIEGWQVPYAAIEPRYRPTIFTTRVGYRSLLKFRHQAGLPHIKFPLSEAQNHRCCYCYLDMDSSIVTVEHVRALSQGGTNHWHNLAAACAPCNRGARIAAVAVWI